MSGLDARLFRHRSAARLRRGPARRCHGGLRPTRVERRGAAFAVAFFAVAFFVVAFFAGTVHLLAPW
jgi:hypothetical protein